jgi:PAS domain S-box-containing protein
MVLAYQVGRNRTVGRVSTAEGDRELRESEERYRAIFENSQSAMLLIDPDTGHIQQANAAACRYYGYAREELTALRVFDLNPMPPEEIRAEMRQAREDQRNYFHFRHRLASGEVRHVEVFSGPVRFGGKEYLHSVIHDIQERRQTEQALQASEAKYRTLAERLGEGLVILDEGGRYAFCNQRMADLLGYTQDEMTGLSPLEVVLEEDRAVTRTKMEERRQGKSDRYEMRLKRKDGVPVEVLISASPLLDGAGVYCGTLALFTDITARKRAEDSARQVQKSESLSLMASGIAHDFNNLFQSIQGNLELALANAADRVRVETSLERALRILGEAASLSRKMLDYSGHGFRKAVPLDLQDMIASRREHLERFLQPGTRLQTDFAEHLPSVNVDPDQLFQVISGLIANASEALGGTGTVELALRQEHLEEPDLQEGFWAEPPPVRDVVSLRVADAGKGISADHLGRIFDPFFTTKAAGRGLGLSATLGIIRNHRGGLQVISSPQGTRFRICLEPLGPGETCNLPPRTETRSAARTILLVDDDADLREVVSEGLREMLGYEVLTAQDGMEAVTLFRENADRIALVLMDAVMPKLSGGQAFEAIKQSHPGAKAILCSGFGDELGREALERHGFLGFLKKPFSLKELGEVIERAVGPR